MPLGLTSRINAVIIHSKSRLVFTVFELATIHADGQAHVLLKKIPRTIAGRLAAEWEATAHRVGNGPLGRPRPRPADGKLLYTAVVMASRL
jgi:hypothetical protein